MKLLAEYISDLRNVQDVSWTEFAENKVIRRFVERTLHLAAECCIDVGSHIIADEDLREPRDNRDVFAVLGESGVISAELATNLERMAGFRNVIVHDYARIEAEIVYQVLRRNLGDLEAFLTAVASRCVPDTAAEPKTGGPSL